MSRPVVVAVLLIAAALAVAPNAHATHNDKQCVLDQFPNRQEVLEDIVQTDAGFGNGVGPNVHEYAILFHEIRTEGCDKPDVIEAFEKKLAAHIEAGGFHSFLSGGMVSFAYATGVILGGNDKGTRTKLTDEIDRLLGVIPWSPDISGDCGFVGFEPGTARPRWMRANNCFDDYSVAAEGYAWRAAYFKKTKRPYTGDRDRALHWIEQSLTNTSYSICVYDPALGVNGPQGPCNSTIAELRTNPNVQLLPLNHTQENLNYGIGLIASIANAFVGLDAMGEKPNYNNHADIQTVMTKLYEQGQRASGPNGQWASTCYRPSNEASHATLMTKEDFHPDNRNRDCSDRNGNYEPTIYPIEAFYEKNGFTGSGYPFTVGDFNTHARNRLFLDPSNGHFRNPFDFFGVGRWEVYYTMGYEWWADEDSRPSFVFERDPVPPGCTKFIPKFSHPIFVDTTTQNVRMSIDNLPAGSTVHWQVFNASEPIDVTKPRREVPGDDPSFIEFNAGCSARNFGDQIKDQIQVTADITFGPIAGCPTPENQFHSLVIGVMLPGAILGGNDTTITAGQTVDLPVSLTGIGKWRLLWSDGLVEFVDAPSAARPYQHVRRVRPDRTTTYKIDEVITRGCDNLNTEGGFEFGEITVTVNPAPSKKKALIFVDDTIVSAGVQNTFRARLSTNDGPVAGAQLTFKALGDVIGTATTDENGRASIVATVDREPGTYHGTIVVEFAGNNSVEAGTGTATLTIICFSSVTVIPTVLNVPTEAGNYDVSVLTSQYCFPELTVTEPWIQITQVRNNGFTVHIPELPANSEPRRGFIHAGAKNVEINQGSDCKYTFSPGAAYTPADNDFGAVTTMNISTQAPCHWEVTPSEDWVKMVKLNPNPNPADPSSQWIPSGPQSGNGNGTITFRVDTNRGRPRSAELRITGTTAKGIVNQEAPPPCQAPQLERDIDGYTVNNGQHISFYPVFSGTNLRYTVIVDGFPRVITSQPIFIIPREHSFYPERLRSTTFRIVASNDCGGASTGVASFFNAWREDDSCAVPYVYPHPGIHHSARANALVSMSVGVMGGGDDANYKYQWYHGFPGDPTPNPVTVDGDKSTLRVSPGRDSFYYATVDDLTDSCGPNYSGVGAVLITPGRRRRAVSHDLTSDGRSDFVWHNNNTGQNEIWRMWNGERLGTPIPLPPSAPGEKIQSIGDLNGDEGADLILRNPQSGENTLWVMNGSFRAHVQTLPPRTGAQWSIGGVADFDDDQNHDVVWHNDATGETEIWFQEGDKRSGTFVLPPTSDANWGLHGAQDFTRDGKPDLFFYNRATGQASVWIMDDGRPVSATGELESGSAAATMDREHPGAPRRRFRMTPQSLGIVQDTNYVPAAVADFNGDEWPDIVWYHKTTGATQIWPMVGTQPFGEPITTPSQPDLSWQPGAGGSTTGTGGSGGGGTGGGATSLTALAQAAPFNGVAIVSATLTSNGAPLSGKVVSFALNGVTKSSLRTDATGAATAGLSVTGIAAGTYDNAITVSFAGDAQFSASSASTVLVVQRQQAAITWTTPAPITYGTPLSATQLNAAANVPGTFEYSPAAGTVLDAGYHALDVTFTPSDSSLEAVSRSVVLLVNKATAAVTWPAPSPIYYGTPLSPVQLNASTSAPGTFTYNPPSGTILPPGTHTLTAAFAPEFGADNYIVTVSPVTLTVLQGTQTIQWPQPPPMVYGQPLNAGILNATVTTTGSAAPGALTFSPAAGTVLPAGTHTLSAFAAPTQYLAGASKSVQVTVVAASPVITWSNPASIVYGTPLSSTQLNATASVPGTFNYSPAAGNVLNAGIHTLSVQFTPSDSANYATVTKSVTIVVTKATPSVTWSSPASIVYGTALSPSQLHAAANVGGTFVYSPAAGTVLNAGTHTLSVQFTPNDTVNYNNASATTSISVAKAPQTITWNAPAPIVYGTVLSQTQLNAAVSVVGPAPAGALTYSPAAGTLLHAGNHILNVTAAATPNYEAATASVTLDVLKAKPVLTWATPAPIVYRTALSAAQLNATANVPGGFVYTPAAGTVLEAGLQTLSTHFTPNDTNNYETADASVTLEIQQATPILTWPAPAGIVYGTPLSSTQLNATADVPGSFVYTPAAGTILDAGNGQTLTVQFTPADTRNFKNATASATLDVAKAKQTLAWNAPAAIVYGTPLSSAQLNATVSVVGPAAAGALVYSPAAGTVLDAGTHTLTVTAQETANYESATMSVPFTVNVKPLSLVVDPKSKLYGGAVPVLTGTLTGVVNNDNITPAYATTATIASPAGVYPITGSLIDPSNRLVNYSVTITPSTLTVLPAPLQISADPKSKQYSDPLPQLTATFTGLVLGETPSVLSGALVLETTATRLSAPGTYPITIGGLASPNYAIVYVNSTFTVTQEDARVTITSPLLISTTTTKPATITLTATIKDISATSDANGDSDSGDIRNATLAFVDRATNATLCTAPIGLVAASDERIGVATCTFTRDSGAVLPASLTVGANIGGHYTRNAAADDVTLTITTPTADQFTGGGALTVTSSAGSHAPDVDGSLTINANLQYDKNGALKGNATFTFKSNGRNYELTATATSMGIVRTATGGKVAIIGNGTLRDVTVTTAPVTITTAPLVITATDAGEPSSNDSVSVALLKAGGGFWLATGWNGAQTAEQKLRDGNLQVHYKK